uniref:Nuclear receptor coactivator 4 n=1 Tax=Acrobeloides nanus TaxID=290746 RepID=A0A914DZD1_9BILA
MSSLIHKRENVTYEHGLRQKLMMMENSVVRIASVKAQLRTNAEQVRKDISNAISHQLQCIRAREQELLSMLESTVSLKEQNLCEQQEQLNQAIGACQQSIECVLRNKTDSTNIQDMLFRLNTIDLRPRDNSHLAFEVDPSALRRAIVNFGKVVSDNRQKVTCESLPIDMEEYDDGTSLAHKSTDRVVSGSIHNWINDLRSRQLSDSDGTWIDDLDLNRARSLTSSSIEVINREDASSNPSDFFSDHFTEIKRSPIEQWLRTPLTSQVPEMPKNAEMKDVPKNFAIPPIEMFIPKPSELIEEKPSVQEMNKLANSFESLQLRRPAATNDETDLPANKRKKMNYIEQNELVTEAEKCFKSMLDSIKNSDKSQWLLAQKEIVDKEIPLRKKSEEISIITPKPSVDSTGKITSDSLKEILNKEKRIWYPTAANQTKLMTQLNDNSLWLKDYPTKNLDRPSNEMAQDVSTWESVLGWKSILEKIHASGEDEWLVPASRNYKAH